MTRPGFNLRHDRKVAGIFGSNRGQVIYVFITFVVILMGFASLGVDIAMLWGARQRMQTAADAAALAASDALFGGGSGNVTTAARASSAGNGFTNSLGTAGNTNLVSVAVNQPPTTGSFVTTPGAVEVIVKQTQPTFFMSVAGISSVVVSARAVAMATSSQRCIYSLDPSASGAILANSGGQITSSCGLMVDSNSSSAITANSGARITGSSVGVVGGVLNNSGATITPTAITGITAFGDPLSALQPPALGTGVTQAPINSGSTKTLNPKIYCGLNVNSGGTAKLNPGFYSFNGSVNVNSGSSITGTGVTLYFKTGTLTLNSGATANLSAPTASGTYEGILVYQDRANNAAPIINSGAGTTMTGALYFPDATLTINSGGFANVYSILVADDIVINSGAALNINSNYSSLADGSPIKRSVIAE
jgi:hypothetical protein